MTSFSIIKPDDLHIHFRDGKILEIVAPHTAKQFGRAIIMPNLVPPVTSLHEASDYRERIIDAAGENFEPLMTLYLTDHTSPEEITKAKESGFVKGVKLYPAGATTNSDSGVTDIENVLDVFTEMQNVGMPLLIHGEVTDKEIDIFDREAEFIENVLSGIVEKFPSLKIVFEHITTTQAAEFVAQADDNVAATITAHHLLFNRNDLLVGGVKPHYYCLPILKREEHRKSLVEAALGTSTKFFAGTDSAPHIQDRKESDCGCAGCYTGLNAVELYAEAFEMNDLSRPETQKRFEEFMSKNGAEFYGMPFNTDKIKLTKKPTQVPAKIETPEGDIIPLLAGEELSWSVDA